MTRDDAILTIHEFVSDNLDGDATLAECIGWCEAIGRHDLPREVDVAIIVLMIHGEVEAA